MGKSLIVLIGASSLLLGVSSISSVDADNKVNLSHMQGEETHEHGMLMIPEGEQVPDVDLVVTQDPVRGWNLEIKTENFEFAPERINSESSYNEGHAHLYVNGELMNRIYGNWFHLIDLNEGENTIRVTLNGNGHEILMYQGEPIEDTEVVVVESN